MNRRRFIWQEAETQSGLPSSYTAVDYLQSSGTQWIDTGYSYGAGSDIEVKFGASADGALLGAQDSDDAMYRSRLWTLPLFYGLHEDRTDIV